MAIREKFAARDMLYDSFKEDYTRIDDYCHEILKTNLGSIIKLNVVPMQYGINDKKSHFRRLYICY